MVTGWLMFLVKEMGNFFLASSYIKETWIIIGMTITMKIVVIITTAIIVIIIC